MRCEARTFDDIRALGGNSAADERCFATVDRVSQTNLALYRTFMQPIVRALVNPGLADLMRAIPIRYGCSSRLFSNADPAVQPVARWAEWVPRTPKTRRPLIAPSSQYRKACRSKSLAGLDAWREFNETQAERAFMAIYGSKALRRR